MRKILIGLTVLMAGCATTQLTPEGAKVRTISPVVAQNCELRGSGSIFKAVLDGGLPAAQVEARNSVARTGGNAMVIVSQYVDPPPYQHGHMTIESYYCKDQAIRDNARPVAAKDSVGIYFEDLPDQKKMELERNSGVLVTTIAEDSPAWKANLIPGDVIIEINNIEVRNSRHAAELMDNAKAKTGNIVFKIIRKGTVRVIDLPWTAS